MPSDEEPLLKILPYDYLEDYDCSLYIDANVIFWLIRLSSIVTG